VRMEVCAPSGLLPTDACPLRHVEWFIDGTQPQSYDTIWQPVTLDRRTGRPADEATPPEDRIVRVYEILPQEARDWAIRHGVQQPPPESAALLTPSEEGLRLLEPDPYTTFELSSVLPGDAQRIRLTAAVPAGTRSVSYWLDGAALGTVEASPWALWWPLSLGDHTLTATALLADGSTQTSDPIAFRVVENAEPQSFTQGG